MDELGEERTEQETRRQNGKLNFSRYMIGGLCLVLFLALTGVGYVQVEERRGGGLRPFVSAENKRCIDCHMAKDVGIGGINDWKVSRHAPKGIGCVECHRAEKGEADEEQDTGPEDRGVQGRIRLGGWTFDQHRPSQVRDRGKGCKDLLTGEVRLRHEARRGTRQRGLDLAELLDLALL